MLARITRWTLVAVAGLLVIGLTGLGAVYAQGPNPAAAPQGVCPLGLQGGMGWAPLVAGRGWGGTMPQTWADALGITVDELTAAVQSGKTVADLAAEKGLTIESLVEKALQARTAGVQQAVEAGRLTQEQADAMLAQMRTRMTESLQNGTCTPGANCQGQGLGTGAQLRQGRAGGMGRGMRLAPANPA